ncbi:MAG: ATP-dependent helicase [Candidatus Tokpelaia sp.]|nr:MAG: ATP-dependent helicase [Candidatus Tokpelaia sp.]KAA6207796.1 MAG: ATP-dependent helicase [Candidatus Tokpelaia sp.]
MDSVSAPDFADLGLSAKVLSSVKETGYNSPTPIQAGAIPAILQHCDVLGIAQTGTGKTASFVLPMLTLLESGRARIRMPRTVIIAPTRELAAQIAENFEKYGKKHRLNIALLIGGVSFDEQERRLERGADVLIATPGRMLDHYGRGKLLLTGVEILVIDEADRMLDMGFIPDIERICKLIPMTRQTLLFSATMPAELEALAGQFLHNPQRIEVAAASSAARTISQYLVKSDKKPWDKRRVLRALIKEQGEYLKNAIIFCNRKRDVGELFRSLTRHGFNVGALHGDMDQHNRMTVLENFRRDKLQLLVASDVAARGLDIPDVSHVFNFDVPIHAEDYVHRIGRTGRAGRSGTAFTIITPNDAKAVEAIEKLIGEAIPRFHQAETIAANQAESDAAAAKSSNKQRKTAGAGPGAQADPTVKNEKNRNSGKNRVNKAHIMAKAERPERQQPVAEKLSPAAKRQPKHSKAESNKILGFGQDMPAFMRIPTQ